MATKYDAIIIGSGQAGNPLAGQLAGKGLKTAMIEKRHFGGTCVNTGCTPTKAYVASARAAHVARKSEPLGVFSAQVRVDLKKVKARKDKMVRASRDGLEDHLENLEKVDVYRGHARFLDDHTVEVDGRELEADRIFINVGGSPFIPEGFERVDFLTNRTILELEAVPPELIIVGGGYVGLEFGQMFHRFGSRVTIVEMGEQLLGREDEDTSRAILDILQKEGMQVRLNAKCLSGSKTQERIVVDLDCQEGDKQIEGTHLLIAAGRRPNTDDLGLENTSVEVDERGFIKVNERLETTADGVWALGDCNGEGAFTHTAYNDYQVVAANLWGENDRKKSDRIPCYALYIDPPLGRAGMTEKQVRKAGLKARMARLPMEKVARAKEKGETQGFMKILVQEETGSILGASILGAGGDEIIHTLLDIMYAGKSYDTIKEAMHIHPTVSELIPTMLQGDLEELEN